MNNEKKNYEDGAYSSSNVKKGISAKKLFVAIAIVIVVIILLLSSIKIIPTGYTGVRITLGQIDTKTISPGLTLKIPFIQQIEKVNNKQTDITVYDRIWSETSERTALYYEGVVISYSICPEYSAWICGHVSNYTNSLVSNEIVASAIKTASKTLNSTDATNRGLIEPLAQQTLQDSLNAKYGAEIVRIHKLTVSNIDFEDTYNEAIAQKQNTQIRYEQQQIQNQLDLEAAQANAKIIETQAQAEANKKKIQAQAEADAKLISAQAEAEAIRIEAEAQTEANEKIDASLTDRVLKKYYYETWNGELPKYVADSETGVMLNVE